jgi:hypothetical protein
LLKIGVAITTHPRRISNGMLQRAYRSAINQRYAPAQVNVAVDLERQGAPRTRQQALDGITAEWTAFLDSDDEFKLDHLRVLAEAQEETGADYVYSWYDLVRFGRHQGNVYFPAPDGTLTDGVFPPTHFTEPWDRNNPRQTTITTLVRTELAKIVGFWDPSDKDTFADGHRVGEDWHFTLECNRLGTIYHVPERTWNWYHHGANTSGRATEGDAA